MCGIFGVIVAPKARIKLKWFRRAIDNLFILSESRGKDSSGLALLSSNIIKVLKVPYSASCLIDHKEYRQIFESINKKEGQNFPLLAIGHARLATNGRQEKNENNQPVVRDKMVGIHNGIIVNVDELWKKNRSLGRQYEVDSEIILALIRKFLNNGVSLPKTIRRTFHNLEGSASISVIFQDLDWMLLATNTGSLYYLFDRKRDLFVFASEFDILDSFIRHRFFRNFFKNSQIRQIKANQFCLINIKNLSINNFSLISEKGGENKISFREHADYKIKDLSTYDKISLLPAGSSYQPPSTILEKIAQKTKIIANLKRCTRCILPETMPFIEFDKEGVCNYCRNYQKMKVWGRKELEKRVGAYRSKGEKSDSIVTFSGGRDSSFGLQYFKKIMKMNPIAYTYDWGVITDLGRRNQARMTGKLGVEHILISADIAHKRENIRKNIQAWLRRPNLGTIPLFMAGDKQYFFYANKLRKIMGIKPIILCINPLEKTDFKFGFCGIRPNPKIFYRLTFFNKLKIAFYYLKEFILNPAYINSSLLDTIFAYFSYYLMSHDYLSFYEYVRWDEEKINRTLFKKYNWEIANDTSTTWRIGDGTAAFYNFIYYILAGFTENDTFCSNQIREGIISREKAFQLVKEENMSRFQSIKWYCDIMGVEYFKTLRTILNAKTLYKEKIERPKRLLVTSTFFAQNKNDSGNFVCDLTYRLAKRGFKITVLAPHAPGCKFVETIEGVKIYRFPYFFPFRLQKLAYGDGAPTNIHTSALAKIQILPFVLAEFFWMIWIIRKEKIEIIQSHWMLPQGLTAAICRKYFKIVHIATAHSSAITILKKLPFGKNLAQFIVKNTDMIGSVSEHRSNELISFISPNLRSQASKKIEIIPMGVDLASFQNTLSKIKLRKKYGVKAKHVVLFVGYLVEVKGCRYLIEAFKEIVREIEDAELVIVGKGHLENWLKNKAKRLNIEDKVRFEGFVDHTRIKDYYALSDVVVIPSIVDSAGYQEGLPVVLLEALGAGKAVVATKTKGIMEVIEDNKNGVLARQKDPQDLAQKIIRVLKSKKIVFLEKNAKETASKYDWKIITQKYMKLIMKAFKLHALLFAINPADLVDFLNNLF